jgi:hypothetical protein
MGKKKTEKPEEKNKTDGEQIDLIDVKPENAKEIIKAAKAYKKAQAARIEALVTEVAEKENLLECIRKAKLQPSSDGSLKFSLEDVKISVTPRDELIKVKFKSEEVEE